MCIQYTAAFSSREIGAARQLSGTIVTFYILWLLDS